MVVLSVGENALDVPVQRLMHPDRSMHQGPATFRRHDEAFDGGLPFLDGLLGFWEM